MAGVLYQGVNYSYSSLNNIAFGVPAVGIVGINWRRRQAKENTYTLEANPSGRGYGKIEYECTVTVKKDWWRQVCDAAPNKNPLEIAPFEWTLAFGDSRTAFFTETLEAFEFLEDGSNVNSGDTMLTMDIACTFAGVRRS